MRVKGLKHGFYEIYWKSGGSSLASVGYDREGYNWFAPCNWTSGSTIEWSGIRKIKLVTANDYSKNIKGLKGERSSVMFTPENFEIEDYER